MSDPALRLVADSRELSNDIDEILDAGFRYAFSLSHDGAEAEDLVQDACLAMLTSGAAWDRRYFFATIRNRFIDRFRRSRKILFLALDDSDSDSGADLTWEAPDVLESGLLDRALSRLRIEEREALFLAVVEGYTAEEIARNTDRPRGTILSILHRAKKKLREFLGGDGGVR